MDHPQQWLYYLINLITSKLPHMINPRTFLPLSLWNIWLTHSRNLYEQAHATVSITYTIHQTIEFSYLAASHHKKPMRVKIALKWIPPKPNTYKLNMDGANSSTSNTDGIGGVIRNHLGD